MIKEEFEEAVQRMRGRDYKKEEVFNLVKMLYTIIMQNGWSGDSTIIIQDGWKIVEDKNA